MPPLTEAEFIAGFHAIGEERYHHKHPFHLLMHEGKLTRGQLQAWALNRYYYQSHIPIKDAAILARSKDPAFRVAWRKRIIDHDGDGKHPGGIEKWLKLVEGTGLPREQAINGEGILPATRYAVQAYVLLVSRTSHLEAVASSLTELVSKTLISLRMDRTREQQELAYSALRAKCDILWAQLDALYFAYVNPGWPPPGAFQPAKESSE